MAFRLCVFCQHSFFTVQSVSSQTAELDCGWLLKFVASPRHLWTVLNTCRYSRVPLRSVAAWFCDATEVVLFDTAMFGSASDRTAHWLRAASEQTGTPTHRCHRACRNKTRFQLVALLGCYAPLVTDVSGQRIGLVFRGLLRLTLEGGTDRMCRNVGNQQQNYAA